MGDGAAIGKMLFAIGGLLVWAVHFTIVYGFTTVACTTGFASSTFAGIGFVPLVIGMVTLLAWTVTGLVLRSALFRPVPPRSFRYHERTENFLQYTAAVVAALALIAVTWTAFPVVIINPCTG